MLFNDVRNQNLVSFPQSSTEPVIAAEFHPCDRNIVVTCGKSHLGFWTLEGGTLTKKLGLFEVTAKDLPLHPWKLIDTCKKLLVSFVVRNMKTEDFSSLVLVF